MATGITRAKGSALRAPLLTELAVHCPDGPHQAGDHLRSAVLSTTYRVLLQPLWRRVQLEAPSECDHHDDDFCPPPNGPQAGSEPCVNSRPFLLQK